MNIHPLADNIYIKRDDKEDITRGGIHLPDDAKQRSGFGTVLAIGRGKMLECGKVCESELRVGDRVVFPSFSGYEFREKAASDATHFLIRESEILGVILEE